jgi:hypothetical protein
MKTYSTIILIYISSILFSSCSRKCPDNLSEYHKHISYTNGELVTFYNDDLGERIDTVYVQLTNMRDKEYGEYDCYGTSEVKYSNGFEYYLAQHDEYYNEGYPIEVNFKGYQCCGKDTIYRFNNKSYNAMSILFEAAYSNSDYEYALTEGNSLSSIEYIFLGGDNPEYKLLEYSTLDTNNIKRKWILKE